jgi:hypothetical protein
MVLSETKEDSGFSLQAVKITRDTAKMAFKKDFKVHPGEIVFARQAIDPE